MPDVDNPLPEYWGEDTYGGFIPEGPKPTEKPKPVSKPSAKSKHTSIKASPPSPASVRRNLMKQCPNTASTRQKKRGKHYLVRNTSTKILKERIVTVDNCRTNYEPLQNLYTKK